MLRSYLKLKITSAPNSLGQVSCLNFKWDDIEHLLITCKQHDTLKFSSLQTYYTLSDRKVPSRTIFKQQSHHGNYKALKE